TRSQLTALRLNRILPEPGFCKGFPDAIDVCPFIVIDGLSRLLQCDCAIPRVSSWRPELTRELRHARRTSESQVNAHLPTMRGGLHRRRQGHPHGHGSGTCAQVDDDETPYCGRLRTGRRSRAGFPANAAGARSTCGRMPSILRGRQFTGWRFWRLRDHSIECNLRWCWLERLVVMWNAVSARRFDRNKLNKLR